MVEIHRQMFVEMHHRYLMGFWLKCNRPEWHSACPKLKHMNGRHGKGRTYSESVDTYINTK